MSERPGESGMLGPRRQGSMLLLSLNSVFWGPGASIATRYAFALVPIRRREQNFTQVGTPCINRLVRYGV